MATKLSGMLIASSEPLRQLFAGLVHDPEAIRRIEWEPFPCSVELGLGNLDGIGERILATRDCLDNSRRLIVPAMSDPFDSQHRSHLSPMFLKGI
jgi:hypothetical protein